jgi:CheY-like chemotaxis protein
MQEIIDFVVTGFQDAFFESVFTAVLTVILILLVAILTGRGLRQVSVAGLSLKFATKETQAAYKRRNLPAPASGEIKKLLANLSGSWSVLWVDDHPEWIRQEMEALSAVGFNFKTVRNNDDALNLIRENVFHLVISDIGRDEGESGIELPAQARKLSGYEMPFVFYVAQRKGQKTPDGDAVTVTPKELYREIACILGD